MPIYMDRHDVAEEVTAEIVAQIHQEDLKIQHKYGCRGITYWYDDGRKTAFCLVEAPNKEAIIQMHAMAHGEVPNTIIEVDGNIVESFLGRIEDPKKSQKTELNIVNNPAFRILVVLKLEKENLLSVLPQQFKSTFKEIAANVETHYGRIVVQNEDYFLISFDSTSNAIKSAVTIGKLFSELKDSTRKLHVGISAGVPVTKKPGLFEETIRTAERLCGISHEHILVTSEVKELYESENLNVPIEEKNIKAISLSDERFLYSLYDYLEKEWQTPTLSVADFSANLGYSPSQLYRKMTTIVNKSANGFIQDFRLEKAIQLLKKKDKSISEIAFETGFNSPAYFTKCFRQKYGLLPSVFSKSL